MSTKFKTILVIFGSVVFSTLALQASDVLNGLEIPLSGLLIESATVCGDSAVLLTLGSHALCVDTYESSPSDSCIHKDPQNQIETFENVQTTACEAVSERGVTPWRNITLNEAQQLCARSGKRLPTSVEWYKAASGITESEECVLKNEIAFTGSGTCVSPVGTYDMIGNVWEWIDAQVVNGQYNGRVMPESGYVALVDTDGIVLETQKTADATYGNDYVSTHSEGVRGLIRGGFYGSGDDGGLYALNAAVPLDLRTVGIGFRCVQDVR